MKLTQEQFEAILQAMLMFENNMDRLRHSIQIEKDADSKNLLEYLFSSNKKSWETLGNMLKEESSKKPL